MAQAKYPLGLCVASIVATWAGLCGSALGVRWGEAGGRETLELAWFYTQVMWMGMWLVGWPLMRKNVPGAKWWEWGAIFVGAIPAVGVAIYLSGVTGTMVGMMLALQFGLSVLAMGVMGCCGWGSGILAMLAVVGPVLIFMWETFFPVAGRGWMRVVPLVAVERAAGGGNVILSAGIYAGIGVGLMVICRGKGVVPEGGGPNGG